MKTIQNVLIGISLLFCGGLMSCTDDTETTDVQQSVKPGLYSIDITLTAEPGVKSETRGLDTENGEFTNVYPYDYIYIHSAKTDDTHQSIEIPLKNVEHCDDCKGIHMQVEVKDEEKVYIIRAGEKEMTLSADDKVYFSTIEGPYWEAETSVATPVSGSKVFVQNKEINKELLKSPTYTKEDLVALMLQGIPTIKMTRHVTGFRVYFMFTHVTVEADGSTNNSIDAKTWHDELKCNPDDFSIKLYLGPNFCHQYNVLNDAVVSGDEGGFYATNNQTYQPFEHVQYAYTTGSGGISIYKGFGYVTDASHYLLSPLNTLIPATDFSIYAFIKYKSSDDSSDEGASDSSDEGASWFQAQIPGITLETNRIHYIIMAFDIEDLRSQFLPTTTTLSRTPWSAPRKIGIKPIKVICN